MLERADTDTEELIAVASQCLVDNIPPHKGTYTK